MNGTREAKTSISTSFYYATINLSWMHSWQSGGDLYDDDDHDDDDNSDNNEDGDDVRIKGLLPRTRCRWAQRSIDRGEMLMARR